MLQFSDSCIARNEKRGCESMRVDVSFIIYNGLQTYNYENVRTKLSYPLEYVVRKKENLLWKTTCHGIASKNIILRKEINRKLIQKVKSSVLGVV